MKPLISRWVRIRIAAVALVFLGSLSLVLLRAVHLQIISQPRLAALAARQHNTEIRILPKRGPIYDRHMQELAVSLDVESIFIRPGKLDAPAEAAGRLAAAAGVKKAGLARRMQSGSPFVWIKRRADPATARAVRALGIPGVGFTPEGRRFYPHLTLGGKLMGFVGVDGHGLEGLELQYDKILRGRQGRVAARRDAQGRPILLEGVDARGAREGQGIVLTIDHAVQYIAETELAAGMKKARARRGIAVVMDPGTGDILALAEVPTLNPNVYGKSRPENRHCWAFSTVFEPGSIFKIFLVAAALDAGAVRPRSRIYCEGGAYSYGGHTIHDVHPYGLLNVAGIIKHSSNIGALKIAERLGSDRFYGYIRDFGFGARSGAGFPGDLPGLLPPLDRWKNITRATIAFGQGISVTPIQITAALSAIANGGKLMQPRLVAARVDPTRRVLEEYAPRAVRRVVSAESARFVTEYMKGVIEKGGTGTAARTPGYTVAGKTGTAQKVAEGRRGYSSKYVGSFIGFVPADNPRLAISVIIDEPKGVPYGGRVAAPIFREIAEKALTYMGVSPDPSAPEIIVPVPEKARSLRARRNRRSPAARRDRPAAAAMRRGGVKTVSLGPRIPDFKGRSIRDALILSETQNITLEIEGSGLAVWQSRKAGKPLEPGTVIKVKFSRAGGP
ncbi:MAG: penicillin-binding protein [Myxococcota bacterium]